MFCVDKDKNRSCRSNNREKFLKQLYEDVKVSPGTPFDFCGGFSACDDAENGQQQEKNDRNYIANSSLSFEGRIVEIFWLPIFITTFAQDYQPGASRLKAARITRNLE